MTLCVKEQRSKARIPRRRGKRGTDKVRITQLGGAPSEQSSIRDLSFGATGSLLRDRVIPASGHGSRGRHNTTPRRCGKRTRGRSAGRRRVLLPACGSQRAFQSNSTFSDRTPPAPVAASILFVQQFNTHGRGQIEGVVLWSKILPALLRLAVVANTSPALRAFRRAIAKYVLTRLLIAANHVRLTASALHLAQRPQLYRILL